MFKSLQSIFMFKELSVILLGIFVGLYGAFTGTPGGSAIMVYILLATGIVESVTTMTGTLLMISCIPIGLSGLWEFYKQDKIDYYVGAFIVLGMFIGIYFGAQYAFKVNEIFGAHYGNFVKYMFTSVVFGILTFMYIKQGHESYQSYLKYEYKKGKK
jgi:uncharacterized membrane protein YfcA